MAFIPCENVMEIVLFGSLAGQDIVSVHHFLYPDAITDLNLETMSSNGLELWFDDLKDRLSNGFNFLSCKATDLTTLTGHVRQAFFTTPEVGTFSGAAIANNASQVISQRSANRGRSGRGRTYSAGHPVAFLTNSVAFSGSESAANIAAWTAWWTDMEGLDGTTHVVLSRRTGGAPRTAGLAQPVTVISANADLDSQRRRLAGRGT